MTLKKCDTIMIRFTDSYGNFMFWIYHITNYFEHLKVTRQNEVVKEILDLERVLFYKNSHRNFITLLLLPEMINGDIYRNQANSGDRIKDVKYYFETDCFNFKRFWKTEDAFNFVMPFYKLTSLLRKTLLVTKVLHFLKILRYKVFTIGTYMAKERSFRNLKTSFI